MWARFRGAPPMRQFHRTALADRRGAVGILFALAMPVLIGFTALGTEVGLWYLERRNLQTAADVSAIAAAFEVLNGTGDEASAAERKRFGTVSASPAAAFR